MTRLFRTFNSLPRAARWLIAFAVAVAACYFIVLPTIDAISGMNGKAAGAEGELGYEGRAQAAREQAGSQVLAGMAMFGAVAFPGDPAERSEAFHRKVNEVLTKHSVQNDRRVTRTAPLGPSSIDAALGQGKRVDRLIMDIQFDATPEQLSAVLADLESAPEVAAVSRVQIRRGGSGQGAEAPTRTVRVSLSAEAWLLARKEGGR